MCHIIKKKNSFRDESAPLVFFESVPDGLGPKLPPICTK